jgi:hypothetical protein
MLSDKKGWIEVTSQKWYDLGKMFCKRGDERWKIVYFRGRQSVLLI